MQVRPFCACCGLAASFPAVCVPTPATATKLPRPPPPRPPPQPRQHCPDCKRALGRLDAALPLLAAASVALLGAAIFAALAGAPPLSARVAGAAGAAALLALVRSKLDSFRALFHFVDYVHAEKN